MPDTRLSEDANRRAVLDAAESLGQLARWEFTPGDRALVWSDNMFRIIGLEPAAIKPTLEYVVTNSHPADRERVAQAIETLAETGSLVPLDFRFVRPDGSVSHLRAIPAVDEWRDGRPYRLIGWVRDVSAERVADRELAAHIAVTEALNESSGVSDAGPRVLAALAAALTAEVGVLWVRDRGVLVAAAKWSSDVDLGSFGTLTDRARLARGTDLPGRAWNDRLPITRPVVAGRGRSTRRSRAADAIGLHGMLAFPAVSSGEVVAVIELAAYGALGMTERLARSLTAIGYEIGHFLARQPAEPAGAALTPRQIEVLELAALGLSARASAAELGVAPATVLAHLANIYERLRVTQKTTAITEARRLGLLA
jgi:DNA-binding NarL/FixJ family response regulator